MDELTRELVTGLLLPGALLIISLAWLIKVPKKDSMYGLRTSRTQISQETWTLGHRMLARRWLLCSLLTGAAVYGLHFLPFHGLPKRLCFVAVAVAAMIVPAVQVDKHLREQYGEGGDNHER